MQLEVYLERIQYRGELTPTLSVLNAIHAAHVCSIPFENIDVQLGRPLTISINDAYRKIVEQHRGGWCYEQNGLFGWALSEIGFHVTRLAASVMRNPEDDQSAANHLCLLVTCPGEAQLQFLVDVGFGGSMFQPLLLTERTYHQSPFELGLKQLDDGYWHFSEDLGSAPFGFYFLTDPGDEQALADKSDFLQNDPSSNFVLNLVAQKRSIDRHTTLRGRVIRRVSKDVVKSEILDSPNALVKALFDEFDLDLPEVANLWPSIVARHNQLFD
jgi:N-hydroxyarylamine O-acetyltransferase